MADTVVLMNQLIQKRSDYTLGLAPVTPSWTLRLFVANHTPVCTDNSAAYTECTLAGYAAAPLTPASWSGSLASCIDTSTYPTLTFTFTAGGQTIYGHYVNDAGNGILGWADLWDTPFVVPGGGGTVNIALQWVEQQC